MKWRDSELLEGSSEKLAALGYRVLLFYFIFAAAVHLIQYADPQIFPIWFRLFGFQVFLLGVLLWLYRRGWRPKLDLSIKAASFSILGLFAYFAALWILNFICKNFIGFKDEAFYQGSTAAVFVLQILAAPIIEELFFRDYLMRSFYLGMKSWTHALVFSSAFFMLAHFSLYPGALILGIINSLLFIYSRSIIPCIGFHLISNLSWYFLPVLFPALFQTLAEKGWLSLFFR